MRVGRAGNSGLAETPFSLGVLLPENMTVKSVRNLKFTAGRLFESFGSPAVGLDLWQL
jgi:hypothetical protein